MIKRVLGGDVSAGSEFVDRYNKLIYSVLTRLCGLPVDHLENAFRHVFVKLFEDDCCRLREWRGETAFSAFLLAASRDLGRNYRENVLIRGNPALATGTDRSEETATDVSLSPEDDVLVSRMEQAIVRLSASLEETCQKILDLKFIKNMSNKEIALAAGLEVSTVGVRLHRCMDTLAQLMKREFPEQFEDRFHLDL